MKLFLVLTACFAAVFARSANDLIEGKIIGGHTASLGQFSYQVGIHHYIGNSLQICGGSLINDRWVLTAGHCVYGATNFKIIAGTTELYKDQPPTKKTYKVIEAHVHPQYNKPETLNYDVALLKLDSPVIFNDYIQPIRLSRAGDYLKPNVTLTMSGWGKIADSEQYVNTYLKYTSLTSISNEKCKTYFKESLVPDYVVCAQGLGTDSPCNGDSGGPLVKIDHDGKLTQVGVFSFISSNGCEKKFPSGFSRVADFLSFIQQYANVMTN